MAPTPASPTRTAPLLTIGVLLYLVSWFAPVYQGQQLFESMGDVARTLGAKEAAASGVPSGPEWLPGWAACHLAWSMLVDDRTDPGGDWKGKVLGSSCLTNLAMLAALLALLCGARSRMLGVLLLACTALDASWIYLAGRDLTEHLRAGYYLWLASFAVTGIGMLIPGQRVARS